MPRSFRPVAPPRLSFFRLGPCCCCAPDILCVDGGTRTRSVRSVDRRGPLHKRYKSPEPARAAMPDTVPRKLDAKPKRHLEKRFLPVVAPVQSPPPLGPPPPAPTPPAPPAPADALQAQVAALQEQLELARADAVHEAQRASDAADDLQGVQAALATARQQLIDLEAKEGQVTRELGLARASATAANESAKEMEAELTKARADLADAQRAADLAADRVKKLEEEITSLRSTNDVLKKQLEDGRKTVDSMSLDLKATTEALTTMTQERDVQRRTADDATTRISALIADFQRLQFEFDEFKMKEAEATEAELRTWELELHDVELQLQGERHALQQSWSRVANFQRGLLKDQRQLLEKEQAIHGLFAKSRLEIQQDRAALDRTRRAVRREQQELAAQNVAISKERDRLLQERAGLIGRDDVLAEVLRNMGPIPVEYKELLDIYAERNHNLTLEKVSFEAEIDRLNANLARLEANAKLATLDADEPQPDSDIGAGRDPNQHAKRAFPDEDEDEDYRLQNKELQEPESKRRRLAGQSVRSSSTSAGSGSNKGEATAPDATPSSPTDCVIMEKPVEAKRGRAGAAGRGGNSSSSPLVNPKHLLQGRESAENTRPLQRAQPFVSVQLGAAIPNGSSTAGRTSSRPAGQFDAGARSASGPQAPRATASGPQAPQAPRAGPTINAFKDTETLATVFGFPKREYAIQLAANFMYYRNLAKTAAHESPIRNIFATDDIEAVRAYGILMGNAPWLEFASDVGLAQALDPANWPDHIRIGELQNVYGSYLLAGLIHSYSGVAFPLARQYQIRTGRGKGIPKRLKNHRSRRHRAREPTKTAYQAFNEEEWERIFGMAALGVVVTPGAAELFVDKLQGLKVVSKDATHVLAYFTAEFTLMGMSGSLEHQEWLRPDEPNGWFRHTDLLKGTNVSTNGVLSRVSRGAGRYRPSDRPADGSRNRLLSNNFTKVAAAMSPAGHEANCKSSGHAKFLGHTVYVKLKNGGKGRWRVAVAHPDPVHKPLKPYGIGNHLSITFHRDPDQHGRASEPGCASSFGGPELLESVVEALLHRYLTETVADRDWLEDTTVPVEDRAALTSIIEQLVDDDFEWIER
ncbi:hypothetical protein DFJ74DRAFT_146073 [Hyaloraphidium curvatum]|nr:hypothetical protein DFJ74DRAFT_146073 [Hyaloraphidium curvatum]